MTKMEGSFMTNRFSVEAFETVPGLSFIKSETTGSRRSPYKTSRNVLFVPLYRRTSKVTTLSLILLSRV